MSWDRDKSNFKEANDLLKTVLPEYEFISKAPSGDAREQLLDGGKLYKSTDNAGNVYLIRNPAAWAIRGKPDGSITRYRPPPELIMTFSELKKAAANRLTHELSTEPKKLIGSI